MEIPRALKRRFIRADLRYGMHLPGIRRVERPAVTIEEVLQHRTDLSTFVVHLTRDTDGGAARENLTSIIHERRLRAVSPKGWATWERFELDDDALETQRVICFSETARARPWPVRRHCRSQRPFPGLRGRVSKDGGSVDEHQPRLVRRPLACAR